jgi:FtsP/CotA-like multicopper oxidase with cupredoxin domain
MLDRRALMKLGLYGGSGGLLYLTRLKSGAWAWAMDEDDRDEHDKHDCGPGGTGGGTGGGAGGGTGTPPLAFTSSLPIPPVKQKVDPSTLPGVETFTDGIPTSYYEINEMQAPVSIMQGNTTMIWGFDGKYLGPTIEAEIGERVVVRMNNMLGPGITSIVHHHGAHVTSAYDGSALWSQQIQPASFKDYIYPNDDDIAATHWYHDHDIDHTGHNVFMGLEGFFLLHDAGERALNLPGKIDPNDPQHNDPPVANPQLPGGFELPFDIPLVIQDRAFDSSAQLVYNPFSARGFLGNTFLVNGAIQPTARVANRKYRLRFLNGSNARFYQLSLRTNTGATLPIYVIGSDGGLYKNVFPVDSFQIGPAERIEVVVDFSSLAPGPNTRVFLNNLMPQTDGRRPAGPPLAPSSNVPQTPGADGIGSIMTFDVQFTAPDKSGFNPTQTLRTDLPVYDQTQATIDPKTKGLATRDWKFERGNGGEWLVNGQAFDPGPKPPNPEKPRIDATVTQNSTEIWRLINGSGGWWHPVHIHRNQFQIIDRRQSGSNQTISLLANEQGLKDVFALEANHEIRVITKFTNGNPKLTTPSNATQLGKYVMHCHNVEHEDMRMMVVWEVV